VRIGYHNDVFTIRQSHPCYPKYMTTNEPRAM
jgi:hypothetical protein